MNTIDSSLEVMSSSNADLQPVKKVSRLKRNMQKALERKAERKLAIEEGKGKERQFKMNDDGSYSYYHPTKGYKRVSAKRTQASQIVDYILYGIKETPFQRAMRALSQNS